MPNLRRLGRILALIALVVSWSAAATGPTTGNLHRKLRAGVFEGFGASPGSVEKAIEALKIDPDIEASLITANMILSGALSHLDVLVFPGGGGARQVNDLGDEGTARVKAFVRDEGKGVVGVCAGAYLLSDTPDYACLSLCGVSAVDREHDERGHGIVAFASTEAGLQFFPELAGAGLRYMYYYEGPLLTAVQGAVPCEVLATFVTDVHLENGAAAGLMPGKSLLVRAESGKGRVFLCAGHPEATPGMRWMLPRMARWTARREPVAYSRAAVRPGAHDREILFDEARRAEESALFQKLLYGSPGGMVDAIQSLVAIRSWDAAKWISGDLRSKEPEVRRAAALGLAELEATWALPDIVLAQSLTRDDETRATLEFAAARLSALSPEATSEHPAPMRREVAVTFDDLPVASAPSNAPEAWRDLTQRLVSSIKRNRVPAAGFVIAQRLMGKDGPEPWRFDLLKAWIDAGLELGNHTYSHPSLHETGLEAYEKDLMKGEEILRPFLSAHGTRLRYFRHPYLQTGRDEGTKASLRAFLQSKGYVVAPVTIDDSDWVFAKAYAKALARKDAEAAARIKSAYLPYIESKVIYFERQSNELLGREVRQILLLHASALNADAFDGIAAMLKGRGYSFIPVEKALSDEAYALQDGYYGPGGISWLHRWCLALGGKSALLPEEPRCPEWVMKEADVESE